MKEDGQIEAEDSDVDETGRHWVWEVCPLHGHSVESVRACSYCNDTGHVYICLDGNHDEYHDGGLDFA